MSKFKIVGRNKDNSKFEVVDTTDKEQNKKILNETDIVSDIESGTNTYVTDIDTKVIVTTINEVKHIKSYKNAFMIDNIQSLPVTIK